MFDQKKRKENGDRLLKIRYHLKFLKISHQYFKHVLPLKNYKNNTVSTSIADMKHSQIL